MKRDAWQETLDAIRDIKAGKVGLSQSRFAELLGVSVRTLQDWEQGRRKPSRTAISLIQIAKQHPDVLREVFG